MTMLRPATPEDLDFVCDLQARPENHALIAEDGRDRLLGYMSGTSEQLLIWARQDKPEGFVLLSGNLHRGGKVELRRLALDEPGRGHGQPLLADLVSYVFDTIGAYRLWFDVASDNKRALRAYERAGFVHEGTLRKHWLRRTGDKVDLELYGMLEEDRPR
ncbi:MAG: GNAT family protein [Pseudomonadota bacterium]